MAYAGVSDVQARWRELDETEQARAAVLLDDASAMLDRLVSVDSADAKQAAALKMVACNMVIRVMSAGANAAYGVTGGSMAGGPYSQSWTYEAPTGDMYLTKSEKAMLGVPSVVVGAIPPRVRRDWCRHD